MDINMVTGKHQNLQPYPVALAKYNINSTFYISGAIVAYSPVASKLNGVSKTVYLNDSGNNTWVYKKTNVSRPLYDVDIPLTAGINLLKKLTVQTGIQLSVVLNKKPIKIMAACYYKSTAAPVDPLTAGSAQQQYTVLVLNMDYRFITGIRYAMKKDVIGIDYEYALQPAS